MEKYSKEHANQIIEQELPYFKAKEGRFFKHKLPQWHPIKAKYVYFKYKSVLYNSRFVMFRENDLPQTSFDYTAISLYIYDNSRIDINPNNVFRDYRYETANDLFEEEISEEEFMNIFNEYVNNIRH